MGGRSWPGTGSSGDGARIAAALGHRIIAERPALVPMIVPDPALHALQGVAIRDVSVGLSIDGKLIGNQRGDLLFTHFGISGPAVLRLSRLIPDPFPTDPVEVVVDCLPDWTAARLDLFLLDLLAREPKKLLRNALAAALTVTLPSAFIPQMLRLAGQPDDLDGRGVTREQRRRLVEGIKACRIPVIGTRGWREAIVTAGGVDLAEVNPKTMASRLVDGLFFAGEMLDLDADTGGYNLQAAWSTGFVAGRSAAAAAAHCMTARDLL
jgi:predicted Rossmann fold flavoprotein